MTFLCLAEAGLAPWYLAITVFTRDIVIVIGAACYHQFIGPFEFSATRLSKGNMFVQISFCVLVLLAQVINGVPHSVLFTLIVAVLFMAVAKLLELIATTLNKHEALLDELSKLGKLATRSRQ